MSDRIKLVPSGRFITDQEGRKVCEMMWPGSPSEQEEIKRRIVAAYNACRWDHQPEARSFRSRFAENARPHEGRNAGCG